MDFSSILQTVYPMSTTKEFAFSAGILQASAIIDAMAILSTVEVFDAHLSTSTSSVVTFLRRLLLIVPVQSSNFLFIHLSWSTAHFHLVDHLTGSGFFPGLVVHVEYL